MLRFLLVVFSIATYSTHLAAEDQVVAEDGGVQLTRSELAYRVEQWTSQMRDVALQDEGDRIELINMVMVNKKVAAKADEVMAENPELARDFEAQIEAYRRDFVLRTYRDNLELPDFDELARERYKTEKDEYALIPERRTSSQILISSPPGVPRDDALAEAESVLQELRNGADFQEMVAEHSDEPNAAAKKGKFDRWIKYGEMDVTPRYSEGLFSIEAIGEYSEPVQSEFGVHIIRLDGIEEQSYKSYDEVKDAIIADLTEEYTKLAMKEFVGQFNLTDDAMVDDEAVKDVLAPYAPKKPAATEQPAGAATSEPAQSE